ncbi:hypothetical protein LPB140_07050 [Sphingorhabdus lutea]|uniref:Cell division protein ZapA n=1 Tax=Sphingorhabdus lutea TaxID=1913578 RepID=A0A1L3JBS5_9SPHN|nr:cell division protein ZapA [Sphingorhabdus lutea]APG62578.1 hypothetical protein LPB140_07050 [Sphingorhabdus lutea]
MADVRLQVARREYIVTCPDGEEARLSQLAMLVDEKAKEAAGGSALTESRQLLFAALLLADQILDKGANAQKPAETTPKKNMSQINEIHHENELRDMIKIIEKLNERVDKLSSKL